MTYSQTVENPCFALNKAGISCTKANFEMLKEERENNISMQSE